MKKLLIFILFAINQLMAQSFQFNDIQPSTAQKWGRENGRNIFVLIENKFYPNSLKIEKEILLNADVKDLLFHQFICLKMNIENESTRDFINKYGLNEEISVVFLGTNDNVLIKESRNLTVDEFIELAEKATLIAKESDPFKFYENEYKSGRNDIEFLEKYLVFLIEKRNLNIERKKICTDVMEKYFKATPEDEWVSTKNLSYLINENYSSYMDSYLYEIIFKLKEKDTPFKNLLTRRYVSFVYNTVNEATKNKDEKLYLKIDSLAKTWEKPETQKYEEFFRKCQYYGTLKDTSKLKSYLLNFIEKEVWEYSTKELLSINQSNKDSLRKDMYLHNTRTETATYFSKVHFLNMNRILAIDILDEASNTILLAFKKDKFMSKKGLEWAERANSLNLYVDDYHLLKLAKLLYLNENKEKAISEVQKKIYKYEFILKYGSNEYAKILLEEYSKLIEKMKNNEEI
jgi:hypothetical protein